MNATPGVQRGCGTRTEGGIYIECGTGPGGKPLEYFLSDAPVPFDVDHKLGVELITGPDGRIHILDWVGSKHYPYAADFLEEGRRFGFSRRASRNLDYSKLSAESRILIVHARGLLKNATAIRPYCPDAARIPSTMPMEHHCALRCRNPSDDSHFTLPSGKPYSGSCSRDHWITPPATTIYAKRDGLPLREIEHDPRLEPGERYCHMRAFASVTYEVYPPTLDAPEPKWEPALIASLPVTNVAIIRARDGSHAPTTRLVMEQLEGRIQVTESNE